MPMGNTEERSGTISVFNGAEPSIAVSDSEDDESKTVATWLTELMGKGLEPHEISIFVRSTGQVSRATTAIEAAGLHSTVLDDQVQTTEGSVSVSTMHLAKGLEFRAVVVMACDDEVIPLQERIESVTDDSDLEDVYNTERHLLYVACTRARDYLLVTGVEPASEFLDDLRSLSDGAYGSHRQSAPYNLEDSMVLSTVKTRPPFRPKETEFITPRPHRPAVLGSDG